MAGGIIGGAREGRNERRARGGAGGSARLGQKALHEEGRESAFELEGDCVAELELDGFWLIEESLAVVFVEELDVSSAVLSVF